MEREELRISDTPRAGAGQNVGTSERWASIAAGSALIAYGLGQERARGASMAGLGTALLVRGAWGRCPVYSTLGLTSAGQTADTRVALAGDRGIRVRESIRVERPVAEVYRFWRRLENLPRVMSHLERVTDLGGGRSHWVAKAPGGTRVEWDAEIVNEVENELIGWRSLEKADVATAGSVRFDEVRGATQVRVQLQYAPPAGRLGKLVAAIFGREPSQTIREDLRRFKQLLEAGEVPRTTADMPGGGAR